MLSKSIHSLNPSFRKRGGNNPSSKVESPKSPSQIIPGIHIKINQKSGQIKTSSNESEFRYHNCESLPAFVGQGNGEREEEEEEGRCKCAKRYSIMRFHLRRSP
jgi:hypothetical protein